MTALTKDRNTKAIAGELYRYPVAASVKIFKGSIVVLDSDGNAKPGVTATGLICVGRAETLADNSTGAAAAINVEVRAGIYPWVNGDTITKTSIGDAAFITDDQTVAKLGTGKSVAGVITAVDSDGVWVQSGPSINPLNLGLLAANNLSDVGTVATARANLSLDTANSPTFAALTLTGVLTAGDGISATDPLLSIGYATGAGGAVTQITSITTGVTLNKVAGQITTVSMTLAAGVDASFTLTNSTIAAGDTIVINTKSYGGTADGIPIFKIQSVAAGSCIINVHNQGGVTLDALAVASFAVIKSVAA